jgi:hypothetical protein
LRLDADVLGTFARSTFHSYDSHRNYLHAVRDRINAVTGHVQELQTIHQAASPLQQQAVNELVSPTIAVATATRAAIIQLAHNPASRFFREYNDHLKGMARAAEQLNEKADRFSDYDRLQQQLQRLEAELEIAGT